MAEVDIRTVKINILKILAKVLGSRSMAGILFNPEFVHGMTYGAK
jgi:hypothetical protein